MLLEKLKKFLDIQKNDVTKTQLLNSNCSCMLVQC